MAKLTKAAKGKLASVAHSAQKPVIKKGAKRKRPKSREETPKEG